MKSKCKKLMLRAALLMLVIVVALGLWLLLTTDVDISALESLNQSSRVYDSHVILIGNASGTQRRTSVPLQSVPAHVQAAFIAAEDARFYSHFGIDPYRMGGALLANIRHLSYAQGASTITQQLVKLTYLSHDKTIARKLREIGMAIKLERMLPKDKILEYYLNTVYFGAGAYGIEAAAQTYFGISASELSLSQSALLAAVIKSPSHYAPHINPDAAKSRRDMILREMESLGYADKADIYKAIAHPIDIRTIDQSSMPHPWAMDLATSEAASLLGISIDELLAGGYQIHTSLDTNMQREAESLFANAANFPKDAADGTPAQAAFVAVDPTTGGIMALCGGREYLVQRGLNRATDMLRQPGSALKPISVYAAAIDGLNMLPTSFIDDTQRDFGGGYSPRNSGDHYYGMVTLRESLSRSLNVASVDLMTKVGIASAMRYAKGAGLPITAKDANLSLALGSMTDGLSPAQLGAAYAPLINGGSAVAPHIVIKIIDAKGQAVYQHREQDAPVMSPQSAYLITSMLQTAAHAGSASRLSNIPGDIAGKTGTVAMEGSGNRDIWTVAYTPRLIATAWMGFDAPDGEHKLPDSESGSGKPAMLCAQFLSVVNEPMQFKKPDGIMELLIDARALRLSHRPMLATQHTPKSLTIAELFRANQMPTEPSNAWIAPMRVFDLSGELRTPSSAALSFTILQENAIYRIYREDEEPTLVAERQGKAGQKLTLTDDRAYEGAGYYVIALHKELLQEGIILESAPSSTLIIKRPFGFRDWIAMPTPDPEPTPMPEEEPLFGNMDNP